MHYILSDIHNNNIKFSKMLQKIKFAKEDHLFILGDLFDRSQYSPDPVGVYFNTLKYLMGTAGDESYLCNGIE